MGISFSFLGYWVYGGRLDKPKVIYVAREFLESKWGGGFEDIMDCTKLGVGIDMGHLSWCLIGGGSRELQPLMVWASNDPPESHMLVARWGWYKCLLFLQTFNMDRDFLESQVVQQQKRTPMKSNTLVDVDDHLLIHCQILS